MVSRVLTTSTTKVSTPTTPTETSTPPLRSEVDDGHALFLTQFSDLPEDLFRQFYSENGRCKNNSNLLFPSKENKESHLRHGSVLGDPS